MLQTQEIIGHIVVWDILAKKDDPGPSPWPEVPNQNLYPRWEPSFWRVVLANYRCGSLYFRWSRDTTPNQMYSDHEITNSPVAARGKSSAILTQLCASECPNRETQSVFCYHVYVYFCFCLHLCQSRHVQELGNKRGGGLPVSFSVLRLLLQGKGDVGSLFSFSCSSFYFWIYFHREGSNIQPNSHLPAILPMEIWSHHQYFIHASFFIISRYNSATFFHS